MSLFFFFSEITHPRSGFFAVFKRNWWLFSKSGQTGFNWAILLPVLYIVNRAVDTVYSRQRKQCIFCGPVKTLCYRFWVNSASTKYPDRRHSIICKSIDVRFVNESFFWVESFQWIRSTCLQNRSEHSFTSRTESVRAVLESANHYVKSPKLYALNFILKVQKEASYIL